MTPRTEADQAECIATSKEPLRVIGGGTRSVVPMGNAAVLSAGGLSGITLHEPGSLTLVAQAGTPLAQIEAALAAEGQRLPFEPMDHRGLLGTTGTPTIGGVVAANVSGPRRIQVGAARDFLLGVRFVDGTGRILKNGGRVMKNVTGYDLVKLMAGSRGRLGVLSEVSFKVLPLPEVTQTLVLPGLDDTAAVRAMAQALGSPYEVTGAAHWPGQGTFLRVEGFAGSVAYRVARLREMLGGEIEESAQRWTEIRDVTPFHDAPGDVWRLSVKPGDAPGIVARAGAEAVLYDWGGGLVWLRMAPGADLRARIAPFNGHATLVRADADTLARLPLEQPEPAALAALSAGIRAKFDPRGIFATETDPVREAAS
ncbi:MAG: FAD-binding protein [Rhodobacterales bacterium]|nr:FAD-binding protein [Rhodobacterales bacterium]MDX5413685.1 FAD-binding protein [Rhodobacterales bacterium]